MLPLGHRLHVVWEGIIREFAAVNIREFVLKAAQLSDLVRLGSMPPQLRGFSRLRSWSARTSLWLEGPRRGSPLLVKAPPLNALSCRCSQLVNATLP